MNCPKCGIATDDNTCPNCKTDILQYALIDKMSFEAYNRGLSFAKEGDISNAIVELEKSVKYNSTNITALNLLGICYDRVGRIADASKYWIRSCLAFEDNVAQEYLKSVEDEITKREKLNESIKMYNQALVYLKQGSFDIASIQLKNAVDRNPNFVEAMDLLALVHIKQGNNDRAIQLLKKVLKIDAKNETATRYLSSLNYKNINKVSDKKSNSNKNVNVQYKNTVNTNSSNTSYVNRQTLFAFGLGLLFMLLVHIFLVIPNIRNGYVNDTRDSEKTFKSQITQQDTMIDSKDQEITNLQSENARLQEEQAQLQSEYDSLNVYVSLSKAQDFLDAGDYLSSANAIYSINTASVAADQIDQYNSIKNKSYPNASKSLYDSGVTKYGQQKYQEALQDFNLSIQYGGTEKSYYPSTLFYLGRCYESLGDNDKAKVYYEKILNEYPNDDTSYSAKSRLNVISQ